MEALKLDPPWRQAVEDANVLFEYGEIIAKDWLLEAFEIQQPKTLAEFQRHQFAFLDALTNFRELLSEHYKKELRALPGKGYEVVKPSEQTDFAKAEGQRDIRTALRRWERRLRNVEETLLTMEQAQYNAEWRGKLAALRSFQRKTLRDKPKPVVLPEPDEKDEGEDS